MIHMHVCVCVCLYVCRGQQSLKRQPHHRKGKGTGKTGNTMDEWEGDDRKITQNKNHKIRTFS
jgi:hypothetical protein